MVETEFFGGSVVIGLANCKLIKLFKTEISTGFAFLANFKMHKFFPVAPHLIHKGMCAFQPHRKIQP